MKTTKKRSIIVTIFLALLLLISGTFAWTALSQRALNEAGGSGEAGGRIHDDYSKKSGNKDIYAENYGKEDLIVRIQLAEYFEENGTPLVSGTTKDNRDSWNPYVLPETTAPTDAYRKYVAWDLGGDKNFLPTFNTNKGDLSTDAAGDAIDFILNGATAVGTGEHDYFSPGEVITNPDDNKQKNTVKSTLKQTKAPMSMADWKALSGKDKIGDFWVIDTDGWAYWANKLQPTESTSLLLDQINLNEKELGDITGEWYYGIDVIGEFVTENDQNEFDQSEHGKPSEDGKDLIGSIINDDEEFTYNVAFTTDVTNVEMDSETSQEFAAKVLKKDSEGTESEVNTKLDWTISPSTAASIDANGKVTVKKIDKDTKLTVTATTKEFGVSKSFEILAKPVVPEFTYTVEFEDDVTNLVMNVIKQTQRRFKAKVVKTNKEGIKSDVETALNWKLAPATSFASVDNTGMLTINTPDKNTKLTLTAATAEFKVENSFDILVKPIKPGEEFDFNDEKFIYLKNLGESNHLVVRKFLLPKEKNSATTVAYNGGDLDKVMKNYYSGLSAEAKALVQPVQTSFTVGKGNESAFGLDAQRFLMSKPVQDFASVTQGGEKKAFALSAAELTDVSGSGKAFSTLVSRGANHEATPTVTNGWWLRTDYSDTFGWCVGNGSHVGELSGHIMTDAMGVRPALIIHQ